MSPRNADNSRSPCPETKKVKLYNDIPLPPVKDGVISASKSPVRKEGRLIDIKTFRSDDLSSFFESGVNGDGDIPEYEVTGLVTSALKDSVNSGQNLRNAVYTYLKDTQHIEFPKSSMKPDSSSGILKALRKVSSTLSLNRCKEYLETDLASLLVEYGKEQSQPTTQNMTWPRIVRGLPVTTTQKPDLAPLHIPHMALPRCDLGCSRMPTTTMLIKPEHSVKCTWKSSRLGVLFYFCGCKCADQHGTYEVGIISLTAPQLLGDPLKPRYF
jgi:hypothetical protein